MRYLKQLLPFEGSVSLSKSAVNKNVEELAMDFSLSEQQTLIKDSARTFFSKQWSIGLLREISKGTIGYPTDQWKRMHDLGWGGMIVNEQYGGIGCDYIDLCLILEEMGRALFPSPYFASCIMGASILSEAANEDIKNQVLSTLSSGEVIVTLAGGEAGDSWSRDTIATTAEKNGDSYVLKGTKLFVPYAHVSDYIICCAKDISSSANAITLFLVDTKSQGVKCIPITTFSIDRYSKVVFDGVKVPQKNVIGQVGQGWGVIEKLLPLFVVSRCLEMVGGIQKVLEMTVQWVKEREQFGVPIGSFQVIQHYCAEMAVDVDTTRLLAYQAAWKMNQKLSCRREVSMAKAWSGEAYKKVTALALQIHGAIGYSEEYDLHFYYKQAKSLDLMYGGGTYHRGIVAHEMGY